MSSDERFTTPDDPDFEGAQFISREAMIQHKVAEWTETLRGITWTWSRWSAIGDDHDHCVICHEAAFSAAYEGDLRDGWTEADPKETRPLWVCPSCFDRFREHFHWRVAE